MDALKQTDHMCVKESALKFWYFQGFTNLSECCDL